MTPRSASVLRWLMIGAVLAAAGGLLGTRLPRGVNDVELGRVRVYPAWFAERGFTFMFAGERGWTGADAAAARSLARAGQRVVGIDSRGLLKAAEQQSGCLYLPGVLEGFSRRVQRQANSGRYLEPSLVGHGTGGALVYLALIQAPALAFSGSVIVAASSSLPFAGDFCDLQPVRRGAGRYLPNFMALGPAAPPHIFVAGKADESALALQYGAALKSLAERAPANPLADLPLVELPAAGATDLPFAILYSGDGGWRDLDRSLAYLLVDKGLSVVGVDVLRYYWKTKPPDVAAADLVRIIRYYQARWRRARVVLIGFSFGADVLPFLVNRLPAEVRSQLQLVSLLSPERHTAFAVDPRSWMGANTREGALIGPELQLLPRALVQCVYGAKEAAGSLCTDPSARGTQVVVKQGSHHFDGNYSLLAEQIMSAVRGAPGQYSGH